MSVCLLSLLVRKGSIGHIKSTTKVHFYWHDVAA